MFSFIIIYSFCMRCFEQLFETAYNFVSTNITCNELSYIHLNDLTNHLHTMSACITSDLVLTNSTAFVSVDGVGSGLVTNGVVGGSGGTWSPAGRDVGIGVGD